MSLLPACAAPAAGGHLTIVGDCSIATCFGPQEDVRNAGAPVSTGVRGVGLVHHRHRLGLDLDVRSLAPVRLGPAAGLGLRTAESQSGLRFKLLNESSRTSRS